MIRDVMIEIDNAFLQKQTPPRKVTYQLGSQAQCGAPNHRLRCVYQPS